MSTLESRIQSLIQSQALLTAAVTKLQLPDLVPLPAPASTAPDGFCQRDAQGKLHVVVYNQGVGAASDSTTRVVFGCADPAQCSAPTTVDMSTAALATPGSSVDLVFDFPAGCFDPFTAKCSFEIGVDVGNTVQESSEINNTAAGVCGPQIF